MPPGSPGTSSSRPWGIRPRRCAHSQREDLFDRVKRVLDELFGSRFLGQISLEKRRRASIPGRAWYCSRIRVGGRQCHIMAGHFPLPAVPGCRVHCSRPPDPGAPSWCTCLHWPAGRSPGWAGRRADGPDGTEACRSPGTGRAPALVFRQVQVQDVVLVVVHGVHKIVEFLHRVVIAAHIHHHAAPAEVRRILDAAARQPGRSIRELVLKLEEGCHGHGFSIGRGERSSTPPGVSFMV